MELHQKTENNKLSPCLQIQELESKQKALLDMKNKAEEQLKEAEKKVMIVKFYFGTLDFYVLQGLRLSKASETSISQPELEVSSMRGLAGVF